MNEQYQVSSKRNCEIFFNGVKPVFRVTLKNGSYIDATDNHPLFTVNGWKEISDLKAGDFIATPDKLNFFGNHKISESDLEIISHRIRVSNCNNKTEDNFIPDIIFTLSQEQIAIFLSRLYNNDDRISFMYAPFPKMRVEIEYSSSSELLIRQIQHLLLRFGIHSNISQQTSKLWSLIICTGKDTLKFAEKISYYRDKSITNKIIEVAKNVEEISSTQLCIYWQEIADIKSLGVFKTYDLSVPDTHNFVANDVIVHNSEVMCIESLHKIFTHKNFRVLYIAPYKNQVNLFFMRVKEILANSPLLDKEVSIIRNNPYTVELNNGSALLGRVGKV